MRIRDTCVRVDRLWTCIYYVKPTTRVVYELTVAAVKKNYGKKEEEKKQKNNNATNGYNEQKKKKHK